jgi:uncharacterized protein (TIGR03545 family)/uncharacterized protein (TIGR03546 family)
MKFLLKLFKSLNSSQNPWQVTLAIVLGMIAGLTPMSGLQNVVILFLAFVLNINLGLFFVSAAFFAGVGYLVDPWMERFGYMLLSSDGLKGLWTAWYNNGLMRMTHFNNTLVMGSTVFSLLLALPLYVLLGWVIGRYRGALGVFLGKYPLFGTFGFLKAPQKKDKPVRWWGAGLFVIAAGLIGAIALLLVDPLLKWAIEKGGSAALQRDVRVGAVDTHFTKGMIDIRRLEIAGKQEGIDAVSADTIRFDIAYMPLLMDKVHIDQIAVKGVGFDTKATLSKAPAKGKESASAAATKEGKGFELPSYAFPDPKSLIAKADLSSVKTYEEAKKTIDALRAKWEKTAKSEFSADALASYEADLKKLQSMSKSKDPQELLKLAEAIKAFKAKIDARKKALASIKNDFDTDQKKVNALIRKVKEAPMRDYNRLKSTYTLDGSGAQNVVGLLFGEKIKGYLAAARKYYAMVSPYLKSDNPPKEALPPRGTGRWMRYAQTVPSPDLLIRLTEIDGTLKSQKFASKIRDISDNQKALGRPLTFNASSDGPNVRMLKINGEDNRLGKVPLDSLTFSAGSVPMQPMALSSLSIAHSKLAAKGSFRLEDASVLTGKGRFDFSDAALRMSGLEGKSAEIVESILSGIKRFGVNVNVGGTLSAPTVAATSDIDKQISQGLGRAMTKELSRYQGELKALLSAQTAGDVKDLQSLSNGIVDVNALTGSQEKALGNLASKAAGLSGGSGAIKGILPF